MYASPPRCWRGVLWLVCHVSGTPRCLSTRVVHGPCSSQLPPLACAHSPGPVLCHCTVHPRGGSRALDVRGYTVQRELFVSPYSYADFSLSTVDGASVECTDRTGVQGCDRELDRFDEVTSVRSRTRDADVAAACPVTAPRLRFG